MLPACVAPLPLVPVDELPPLVCAPPLVAVFPVLPTPTPVVAPLEPVSPESTEPLTHEANTPMPVKPNNKASPCRNWIILLLSYHRANDRASKPMQNLLVKGLTIVKS
jgi:hypothetical protein